MANSATETNTKHFPEQSIRDRLTPELQSIADEAELLRPDWEPLLDSKRVVSTVILIEELFDFPLPPDKVIRKGGYNSVEESADDIVNRLRGLWTANQAKTQKRLSA